MVSPPPLSGGPLATSVRPTEQMFVPSPRASARRAEASRSRARVGLRVGRDSRATPAPPAENLPTTPLAWAFAWASRGERVHRVLRTKTSDRGAWNPYQDRRTLPVAGAWSQAHSGNFRPRPERAHFPRCARIAEQRGRLGGRRACASCGSGGGGGTAAGRGAGAQNTGGAGAQPPFEGACRSIVAGECIMECPNPNPPPPRLWPPPAHQCPHCGPIQDVGFPCEASQSGSRGGRRAEDGWRWARLGQGGEGGKLAAVEKEEEVLGSLTARARGARLGDGQSTEFKFRFVFFRLQMLRFSALCGHF